ncbi:hypothetical protein INT43_008017 [Umbelopsis isabellina]|uniref:Uncharacterized protein n=1 Tax=Mortierella isabellina TaxID=91625 RepID=A0A8H7PPC3_MORIS|nr:hypothetical protein INT43_008017 [Umbelopsis isabellina]
MTPETSISETSKSSDFRESELRERPPTPIDWEGNILEGLDVLTVPVWTDEVKSKFSNGQNDGQNKSNVSNISLPSASEEVALNNARHIKADENKPDDGLSDMQQKKMLHQIQSDLLVKEELVGHLQRSQAEYMAMKENYEDQLLALRDQMSELQQEARMSCRTPDNRRASLNQPHVTTFASTTTSHELEIKKLAGEIQELQKKYNHSLSATQTANAKNEKQFHAYKLSIEYMKLEKKRLVSSLKEQCEKTKVLEEEHRTQLSINRLERDELAESVIKLNKELQSTKALLKKKSEEAATAASQMKQMIPILDRAFKNGLVYDELPEGIKSKLSQSPSPLVTTQKSKFDGSSKSKALRKKQQLERMIQQYVQADQRAQDYKQMLIKRNMICMEMTELASERDELNGIDQISVKSRINALNYKIEKLTKVLDHIHEQVEIHQNQFSNSPKFELDNPLSRESNITNSSQIENEGLLDRKGAYDRAMNMVRSVNAEEGKLLAETLLTEVLVLKSRESSRDVGTVQTDYTMQNLRKVLASMKDNHVVDGPESLIINDKHLQIEPDDDQYNSVKATIEEPHNQVSGSISSEIKQLDLKSRDQHQAGEVYDYVCSRPHILASVSDEFSMGGPPDGSTLPPSIISKRCSFRLTENHGPAEKHTKSLGLSNSLTSRKISTLPLNHRRWTLQASYCTSEDLTANPTNTIFDRLANKHTLASHAKINPRLYYNEQ